MEIYAQFVETNVLVKHNIYHELKLTIMDLDLQITWKHTVAGVCSCAASPYMEQCQCKKRLKIDFKVVLTVSELV